MKDIPVEQREMILSMIEKNPDFFQNIAGEIQAEVAKGKEQMSATMEVMKRHEDELKGMVQK